MNGDEHHYGKSDAKARKRANAAFIAAIAKLIDEGSKGSVSACIRNETFGRELQFLYCLTPCI